MENPLGRLGADGERGFCQRGCVWRGIGLSSYLSSSETLTKLPHLCVHQFLHPYYWNNSSVHLLAGCKDEML